MTIFGHNLRWTSQDSDSHSVNQPTCVETEEHMPDLSQLLDQIQSEIQCEMNQRNVSATSYRYGILYVYVYICMHVCVCYTYMYLSMTLYKAAHSLAIPLEIYDPLWLANAAGKSLTITKSWLRLPILQTTLWPYQCPSPSSWLKSWHASNRSSGSRDLLGVYGYSRQIVYGISNSSSLSRCQ